MDIPTIGIGMLGYGDMGKAHSNGYLQMPYIFWPPPALPRLLKMCGRNEEKVKDESERFGFRSYCTDWKEIVEDNDIDMLKAEIGRQVNEFIPIEKELHNMRNDPLTAENVAKLEVQETEQRVRKRTVRKEKFDKENQKLNDKFPNDIIRIKKIYELPCCARAD